jgi:hypothetical protein
MQDFNQWLETNHPELNESLGRKIALGAALALGTAAPNYTQAGQEIPEKPAATNQEKLDQLHQKQNQRKMWKTPLIAAAMGAAAAARAAKRKQS